MQVKPPGTETTIYINGLFEKVVKPNGTGEYKNLIVINGELVAQRTLRSTGVHDTRYFHKDHLGSVQGITNEAGAMALKLSYDAFGQRRNPATWTGALGPTDSGNIYKISHEGFTEHEHLDSVDQVHMNGRVYDPAIGQFTSADPFVQQTFNGQSLNRYSYVMNNPLSFTDPTGFLCTVGVKNDNSTTDNCRDELARDAIDEIVTTAQRTTDVVSTPDNFVGEVGGSGFDNGGSGGGSVDGQPQLPSTVDPASRSSPIDEIIINQRITNYRWLADAELGALAGFLSVARKAQDSGLLDGGGGPAKTLDALTTARLLPMQNLISNIDWRAASKAVNPAARIWAAYSVIHGFRESQAKGWMAIGDVAVGSLSMVLLPPMISIPLVAVYSANGGMAGLVGYD